ncbi:MAG: hypothetical protein ACXWV1_14280 [Chitinophagaceae bacterium]
MIRKLKSEEYRIYSRKKDPKPISDTILALFLLLRQPKNMKKKYNSSNAIPDQQNRMNATYHYYLHLKLRGIKIVPFWNQIIPHPTPATWSFTIFKL